MFNPLRTALLTLVLASASAGAFAHGTSHASSEYGNPAPAASAERHITITDTTKWVNLNDGDTVEFTLGERRFTWHFDTLNGAGAFDLSKIAPSIMSGKVIVYLGANPLYQG
jgi:hypothetical protein